MIKVVIEITEVTSGVLALDVSKGDLKPTILELNAESLLLAELKDSLLKLSEKTKADGSKPHFHEGDFSNQ